MLLFMRGAPGRQALLGLALFAVACRAVEPLLPLGGRLVVSVLALAAVRLFADALNMYSYYGPSTVTGTFGISLLSKYPIESPRTFFMHSAGEQTATIHARITAAGRTYNVFVTHTVIRP